MQWFDDPSLQAALIAAGAAFLLTGAARLVWGTERDPRRAAVGAGVVIPIAIFAIAGAPRFPLSPRSIRSPFSPWQGSSLDRSSILKASNVGRAGR